MAASLPTGTVTFLFTDIEGSTRLMQQLGDKYATLLADHQQLLREACETHHGSVVDTQGDSSFAAFSRAMDAIHAVVQSQQAFFAHDWVDGVSVRVRMSLHTGEPQISSSKYVGIDVHRAARIAAAAHGGQVLLSQTTYDLVENELPDGVTLRDLGNHPLKDLRRPKHLYQLVITGLPSDFPPLMSLEVSPNNLPIQLTSFIGRTREIREIKQLLSKERLVTLTGPGGSGKTRLALQAATEMIENFLDGVFFIELAQITDSGLVASAIAQSLGLTEMAGRSIVDRLKDYLHNKSTLLLLDSFEQVISAAPLVAELLAACGELKVLVTSRESLRISGEREYPVPPLVLPNLKQLPPLESLSQYAAVELFIQRAQAVKPDFRITNDNAPAVAEICCRLDGLPLAIELAAARIKLMPPQAMLARLEHRLELLTGGARNLPVRQQTLRNAIDWSYNLLEEGDRRLFKRLSIFVGGCTIEAAEAVCDAGADLSLNVLMGLASLVDKNLIVQEEVLRGEPRFGMLETIREYAREKLVNSGEAETIQQRHFVYFLSMAEAAEAERPGPEEELWLHRFEREHGNLRAALDYGCEQECAEATLQLATTLEWFWRVRGYLSEGSKWMERILTECQDVAAPVRTKALMAAERLAQKRGDYASKKRYAEEHLELSRSLSDTAGIAWALHSLGDVARDLEGDYAQAANLLHKSVALFREVGETRGMAGAINCLGEVARCQEKYQQAKIFYEESLALERRLENKDRIALVTSNLGSVELNLGALEEAEALFKTSMALSQELGYKSIIAGSLAGLAGIAHERGDPSRAARLLGAASSINETIGSKLDKADSLEWDRILAAIRAQLDQVSFTEAWTKGGKMTMEQAISYGFEVLAIGP